VPTANAALLAALVAAGAAADDLKLPDLSPPGPKPRVMVVGTFHMANPNLDYVKANGDDMLSPRRQAEIRLVLDRLKAFAPTRIAVEAPYGDEKVNERYRRYLAGDHALGADEVDQIGLRLAKELGLARLDLIDFRKEMDIGGALQYAAEHGQAELAQRLQTAFAAVGQMMGALASRSVLDQLRIHNDEAVMGALDRGYLLLAEAGAADHPIGADVVAGWYERNLKIAMNVVRLAAPKDRVLVLIGSGHGKLLRQFLRESPDVELASVLEYLGPVGN
jgi:hypothetical protein